MDYYDLILASIPAALVGTALALSLAGFETSLAVPIGATLAIGLIGHAMFVRSPLKHSGRIDTPGRQNDQRRPARTAE